LSQIFKTKIRSSEICGGFRQISGESQNYFWWGKIGISTIKKILWLKCGWRFGGKIALFSFFCPIFPIFSIYLKS
jgi:hypothetical protein